MSTCNIHAKGKAARLVAGVILALAGMVLMVLAVTGVWSGWLVWGLSTAGILLGGFMIYEGAAGWCVLRAMGIRTPF